MWINIYALNWRLLSPAPTFVGLELSLLLD